MNKEGDEFLEELNKNKEIMINTLENKIKQYSEFFNYFKINEDNFSKSLKSELNTFGNNIKYNERLLTEVEKNGLIFIPSKEEKLKQIQKENKISQIRFTMLKRLLKSLNLTLKVYSEKIKSENKNDFDSKSDKNYNFDFIFNKVAKLANDFSKTSNYMNNPNENNDNLNKSNELNNEILNLQKINYSLKEDKDKLEIQINKYCNLPSDINQIKAMIAAKRIELSELEK
jgi:hypothetical protein